MDIAQLFVPLQILFNVFFLVALLSLAAERSRPQASGREDRRRGDWRAAVAKWIRSRWPRRKRKPETPTAPEPGVETARRTIERLLARADARERDLNGGGEPPGPAAGPEEPAAAELQARIERFRRSSEGGHRAG